MGVIAISPWSDVVRCNICIGLGKQQPPERPTNPQGRRTQGAIDRWAAREIPGSCLSANIAQSLTAKFEQFRNVLGGYGIPAPSFNNLEVRTTMTTTMLKAAPSIRAPRRELLDELALHLANDSVEDGSPMLRWDEQRGVFLIAIPQAGRIVHWQLEACADRETAAALTERCKSDFALAVRRGSIQTPTAPAMPFIPLS